MDFAKTTLAIACAIILIPIRRCGGCLSIAGVGTSEDEIAATPHFRKVSNPIFSLGKRRVSMSGMKYKL